MPPRNRKPNANPKERRHENGLARPGKQIKKQKSDGYLNGNANTVSPSSDECTTKNTSIASHSPLPTHGGNDGHNKFEEDFNARYSSGATATKFERNSFSPSAGGNMAGDGNFDGAGRAVPARLDLSDRYDEPSPDTTVIRPCSVRDVVAILLLLLQLPPVVLTLLNVFFAFLTFGSVSAGWSVSSVASSPDWLQSYGGSPSIVTTIITDLVFLAAWCLLPLGRDLTLDLAQAVVAISLAGGASGRSGKVHSAMCLWIIAINHLLRHKQSREYGANVFWSLISRVEFLEPYDLESHIPPLKMAPFKPRSWPRILIELHIVCQGLVRMIRRSYFSSASPKPGPKKADPESPTAHSLPHSFAGSSFGAEGGRNTSTDGRQPGPSPAARESKDKSTSNNKRRRKQATFVRSQQPFWAAIASTKVTLTKELEQSQASQDPFDGASFDSLLSGTGINDETHHQVWINDIRDTEVQFSKTHMTSEDGRGQRSEQESFYNNNNDSGDTSDLVVRVNGAIWGSKLIYHCGEGENALTCGKIFGLTPSTNYMFEFVRPSDGVKLHTANLLTQAVPNLVEGSSLSPAPQQALRPSSPTTTLKNSIAAAEAKLAEDRNRSKKNKKDHRSSTNAIKKEVESLEGRLSSFGGNDDRQRQRQFQYRQNIRQAEDACAEIVDEIESFGGVPNHERQEAEEGKKNWSQQKELLALLRSKLSESKAEGERKIQAAHTENATLQQKRERIAARLQKLNSQRENLLTTTAQNHKTYERREQDRASLTASRQVQEREILTNIQRFETQRQELEGQVNSYASFLHNQDFGASQQSQLQQQVQGPSAIPQTPESSFAGLATGKRVPPPGLSGISGYPQSFGTSPPFSNHRSSLISKNRGRSSSMLSNVSGVTDMEIGATGSQQSPNGLQTLPNGSSILADDSEVDVTTATRHGSTGSGGSHPRTGSSGFRSNRNSAGSVGAIAKPSPIGTGRDSPRNHQQKP